MDDKDTAVVVCTPTSNPHVQNVSVEKCSECGSDVWLAASTVTHAHNSGFKNLKLVCIKCVKLPSNVVYQMPSDEQIAEIAKEKGLPAEEVLKVVKKEIHRMNRASKYNEN